MISGLYVNLSSEVSKKSKSILQSEKFKVLVLKYTM